MKILYKFASRSRPEKFIKCIENISINQNHEDYLIFATLDTDDLSMNNEDMIEKMKLYPKLYVTWGKSDNKIHAINRDMELAPDFDILINMSDDMLFVEKGYDKIIIEDMLANFPDLDGVLHYNDGNQFDNVMTMTIYGKPYYDRFKYIYHPSYISLFADNEQTSVAKQLVKYKYMGDDKIIFKHFHPAWGLSGMDSQYEKTEARDLWDKDEANHRNRRNKNFDL